MDGQRRFTPPRSPLSAHVQEARIFADQRLAVLREVSHPILSTLFPVFTRVAKRLPSRWGISSVLCLMGMIGVYGSFQGGHVEAFHSRYGTFVEAGVRVMGFGLNTMTLTGLNTLEDAEVLKAAGLTGAETLPFMDVEQIRSRLETHPLVKEASVRKIYPHGIHIDVSEREPFAVWQHQGELAVIAADGTILSSHIRAKDTHLPFVVGDGAHKRVREYTQILEQSGSLRHRIKAAILVSERRWTLKLDNGLDVRLPEQNIGDAMARLIIYAKDNRVLDRDILAIDLRVPDRITLRLTEEAVSALQEQRQEARKKAEKGGRA
jgi:cell division protein FtsQ